MFQPAQAKDAQDASQRRKAAKVRYVVVVHIRCGRVGIRRRESVYCPTTAVREVGVGREPDPVRSAD